MTTKVLATLAGAIWLGAMMQNTSADPAAQCSATDAPSWTVLSKTLRKPDIEKGEFETTAVYKARLLKAFGTTTFRVVIPVNIYGKYDADHEKLDIDHDALAGNFDPVPAGAANESWFGARIDRMRGQGITGPQETDYDLVFKGTIEFEKASATMHMPLADAKKQIANLKIVVAGEMVAPYTSVHVLPGDATSPERVFVGLVVQPMCGAIVDGRSGRVLATFDPARMGY
jgi:hypothetical protein